MSELNLDDIEQVNDLDAAYELQRSLLKRIKELKYLLKDGRRILSNVDKVIEELESVSQRKH